MLPKISLVTVVWLNNHLNISMPYHNALYITYTNCTLVVPPVITNTVTGNSQAGIPQFIITTDQFSSRYGTIGTYKVVVVRDSSIEPASIPDGNLLPATNNPFK